MTIGLAMIVRDEAEMLPRTIPPILDLIDFWTVVDTGSEDDTVRVTRELLGGVPGRLYEREWHSHARNRTELLALARGTADYLLLLDADLLIVRDGDLPELSADIYTAMTHGGFAFSLTALVKGDRPWEYRGAAHSFLAAADGRPVKTEKVPWRYHELRSVSPRADKFERDVELLEEELREKPGDTRATFYLAQTYRDLGRTDDAIETYGKRAEMGGWEQEVFWARYQQGSLLADADLDRAIPILLKAYDGRPTRAEPLYVLAKLLRTRGQASSALALIEKAVQLDLPEDTLFVLRWIYDWGARLELAHCLNALGHHELARPILESLADTDAALYAHNTLAGMPPQLDPDWSLPEDVLKRLTALVKKHKPKLLVECGSGYSTVALAKAVGKGRLVSLEHEQRFAERTRAMLNGSKAEVRHAPIAAGWYAEDGWKDLDAIDMLIVDGPPGSLGTEARYPALPLLRERLSDKAVIILDDVFRPDEQAIIERWQAEFGIKEIDRFGHEGTEGMTAVFTL